ncbi:MAG: CapA family protein [Clostridiales Family XIII bacterium]|jgi:poly-gamma-glutamate synthesis protein (capsule biosynthesis protein)|nr:CapA family protein [Clostridiales Family XIII bacterium]
MKHSRRGRRRKLAGIRLPLTAALVIFVLAGAYIAFHGIVGADRDAPAKPAASSKENAAPEPKADETVHLTIDCIGDVMMHTPQIKNMYGADGAIDLSLYFEYIKEDVAAADLALCNIETTFGGTLKGGGPALIFSGPDELASAIAGAGFDVGITANNHMLDSGYDGLLRTIKTIKGAGLQVAGSRESPDEPNYLITEVKGIKVAVVAWTYESGKAGDDNNRLLNGNPIPAQAKPLMNSYVAGSGDEADISRSVEAARADGAQIVICYFHWGNEYQREPHPSQRQTAQIAADAGADIIFASHPHVLQTMETIGGPNGKQVPVYWSMGNYISNQRQETLNNHYTEQGIIAKIGVDFNTGTNAATNFTMSYMPLWVDRYNSGNRVIYTVIPLTEGYENNASLRNSGHLSRAKSARAEIIGLLGEDIIWHNE